MQGEKIKKSDIEDIIEITRVQEGMLFHYQENPNSNQYFEQLCLNLQGKIDTKRIRTAWERVVEKNKVLRSVFRWDGLKQPIQIILKQAELEFVEYDYTQIKNETICNDKCEELLMKDREKKFTLDKVPFRITLCRKTENECMLIMSNHHIILDGWSTGIVLKQFIEFYENENIIDKNVSFKLSDYINYMRTYNRTEAITYWKEYLEQIDSPTLLETEGARKGQCDRCTITIDSKPIVQYISEAQVSLAEFFYSAWALLLRNYVNNDEVVFGTTIAGRNIPVPGIENAVGLFINTVPMRVEITEGETIKQLYDAVRKDIIERQDYEFISQSEINQALKLGIHDALYDSIVVVENYPLDKAIGEGQELKLIDYKIYEKTNYNITVNIAENKGSIEVSILYQNEKFEDSYIENLLNHYVNIITGLATQSASDCCEQVEMLSQAEKKQILEVFNDTECSYLSKSCIHYEFEKNVEKYPDRCAVQFDGQSMSYKELNHIVNFHANNLRQMGVKQNTIVGVLLERSFEMIISILAILKAGGAYLPIPVDVPEERLRYMIENSGLSVLMTVSKHVGLFQEYPALQIVNMDEIRKDDSNQYGNPEHINEKHDMAYIIYTSGTTGNPKGVMIEQHSVMNRIGWMDKAYAISQEDVILQKTPYTFDVSVWELLWWSQKGASLCFLKQGEEKKPDKILDAIAKYKVTTMHFVPAMFSVFIEYLEENRDAIGKLESLKRIFTSGEALNANQVNRFYSLTDSVDIVNLYGPTEATVDVSCYHCHKRTDYTSIPIGKPIDNTKLFIVNTSHNLQPIGIAGELCICGVNLAKGYLNNEALTGEKFRTGSRDIPERFYKTGDIARWLPDGNIEYLGRCDEQVKMRGLRIELGEIENVIGRFEAISEVAAAVKKSKTGDKQIVAYYVAKEAVDLEELKSFILKYSPEYMVPAYFMRVEEMPKSANGKISRKKLLELKLEVERKEKFIAPETKIQERISEIFRELIDINQISIYDNFFMLGGDSIRAIRLVSRINKEFNIQITISDLYHNSTIADLEKLILDNPESDEGKLRKQAEKELEEIKKTLLAQSKEPDKVEDIFPLTDIQNGMVLYYLKDEKKDVYFEQFVFEAKYTGFDQNKYKQAVEYLVMENPILRTAFDMDEYLQPVQIVYKEYGIEYQYKRFEDEETARTYLERVLAQDKARKFVIAQDEKLWRLQIVSIRDEYQYFVMTCHHAILDGWSVNYMMAVIHEKYIKLLEGKTYEPQLLGVTYKDALIDEMVEKKNESHKKYWYEELNGYQRLELNVRYEHNRPEEIERITKYYVFEKDLYENLKEAAKRMKTSVKNICFSAYTYILHMLSGQNDFVVGFLTNNRTVHENGDRVLGCYLNTVPVRVKIPYGINWVEYQKQMDAKLLEVKKHERMSLFEIGQIIEEKSSDNLFFDTLYNFMDFSMIKDLDQEDIMNSSSDYEGHQDTNTLFDFMLDVSMGQMKLTLRYSTSIFGKGIEEYIFRYFTNILECIIKDAEHTVKVESVLPKDEMQLLIETFNHTDEAYNETITIHELFEESVNKYPDNTALCYSDGSQLTYDCLNRKCNQFAHMLREHSVTRNEFVAIIMERTPAMVEAIMGVLKSGGAYLPIEPYTPDARIKSLLQSTRATKIITSDSLVDRIKELTKEMNIELIYNSDNQSLDAYSEENPEHISESTDIAYVIFTSGTTGTPKGVYVNHKTVINVLEWVQKNFHVQEQDKLLFVTSPGFDLSVYDMFGILSAGATLRLTDSSELQEPERLLEIINTEQITFWDSAPQALMRLVPFMGDMEEKNQTLRLVFLSGDWIPVSLPDELRAKFVNLQVVSLGGATEATIWSNYYKVNEVPKSWPSIPYGQPMQNARYYVLDENLSVKPMGAAGELYIGGINGNCLAQGYINDPKLTDEKFIKSPFHEKERLYKTGDRARWYENGILEFLGRLDLQVKIRGYRIELEEIEYQLLQMDSITQAVVIVKDNLEKEKYLCAFVVSKKEIQEDAIKQKLEAELPKYMIPNRIQVLDSIPVTSNGKVDKKKLDAINVTVSTEEQKYAQTQIEAEIETIWQEVLNVKERIPVDIDYFEFGGNSLNASMIVVRIKKKFGVDLTLREFFVRTTIAELAEFVEENCSLQKEETALFTPVTRDFYPLSAAQERMYILSELENHSTNYNATSAITLLGAIDIQKIERVFQKIIARHDILRTAFVKIDGSVKQKVLDKVEFHVETVEAAPEQLVKQVEACIRKFDLSAPPLIRVCLIKTEAERHVLVLDLHHIVSDGVSTNVITEEFINLYQGNELAVPALQYKDYAVWEKEDTAYSNMLHKQEEFWKKQLADEIESISLPYDYERPQVKKTDGARIYFEVEKEKVNTLKHFARKQNTRLYHVLFSSYYLLLYKYSRQSKIVIGTAMANRRQAEVERMLGVFANSLPVCCTIDGTFKYADFLQRISERIDEVEENQEYPFDKMVQQFSDKRDMSRNPFFDVLFIMQTIKAFETKTDNFALEPYHYFGNTAKFDLFLEIFEIEGKLDVSFEYCTSLFKESTILRFKESYLELIEKLTTEGVEELSIEEIVMDCISTKDLSFVVTKDDMQHFAKLSGDYNPLHVDENYAAVTPFGRNVVFGALGILKALGLCLDEMRRPIRITSIESDLNKPLFMDTRYTCHYNVTDDKFVHLDILYKDEVLTEVRFAFVDDPIQKVHIEAVPIEKGKNPEAAEKSMQDISSYIENGVYQLNYCEEEIEWAKELKVDSYVICILAFSSWVIGMRNPGKQALFTGVKIEFDGTDDYDKTDYFIKSVKFDEDFQKVVMKGMLNQADSSANIVLESYVRPVLISEYESSVAVLEGSMLSKCTQLKDKNVLILGGSRGLGAELAFQIASLGGNVIITYAKNENYANQAVKQLKEHGFHTEAIQADIEDSESTKSLYKKVMDTYKKIDMIVNCAYPHIESDSLGQFEFGDFKDRVEKPIQMTYNVIQTFAGELNRNNGQYICISSIYANQVEKEFFSYGLAKAAIEKMVLHLGGEYSNIRVRIMRPEKFLSNQTCSNITKNYLCEAKMIAARILEEISRNEEQKQVICDLTSQASWSLEKEEKRKKRIKTVLCSTFTADVYGIYIEKWLELYGIETRVEVAPYNQVFQQFLEEESILRKNTGVSILMVRLEDWLGEYESDENAISKLNDYYTRFVNSILKKPLHSTVLIGILKADYSGRRSSAVVEYMETLYEKMETELAGDSNVYFVDLTRVMQKYNVSQEYDEKKYREAKIPFTNECVAAMGTELARKIVNIQLPQSKVIVLDCDNTLWQGMIGEDGIENIQFTDAYRYLQEFMKKQYESGKLLAICSKNNKEVLMPVFDKPEMILKPEMFVNIAANWEQKHVNIRKLAKKLNLGLDSFIFIDDDYFECRQMAENCPEVFTLQLPDDKTEIRAFLEHVWVFDYDKVTQEDRERTQMYQESLKRQDFKEETESMDDFLKKLHIKVNMSVLEEQDMERAAQMTYRTNQFNLSTKRRSVAELKELLERDNFTGWKVSVSDDFGSYGISGLVIGELAEGKMQIDTLLLSCRVLGKNVENSILEGIKKACERMHISQIEAEYRRTEKNSMVAKFFDASGWNRKTEDEEKIIFVVNPQTMVNKIDHIELLFEQEIKEEVTLLTKVNHMGLAVRDFVLAKELLQTMGFEMGEVCREDNQNSELCILSKRNYDNIELVKPINQDSPTLQMLKQESMKFYHMCYEVENFGDYLEQIKKAGLKYSIVSNSKETELFGGKPVMFLYVEQVGLIELLENKHIQVECLAKKDQINLLVNDLEISQQFFTFMGYKKVSQKSYVDRDCLRMCKNYEADIVLSITKKGFGETVKNDIESMTFMDSLKMVERLEKQGYVLEQSDLGVNVLDGYPFMQFDCFVQNEKKAKSYNWNVVANQQKESYLMPILYNDAEKILLMVQEKQQQDIPKVIEEKKVIETCNSETEKLLVSIWCDVLHVNEQDVDINQNFFARGGNSFALIEMNSRIQDKMDLDLDLIKLFEHSTIKSLASYIDSMSEPRKEEKEVKAQQEESRKKRKDAAKKTLGVLRRK